MDLIQKSITGKMKLKFEEWFLTELAIYPTHVKSGIIEQLSQYEDNLPEKNGFTQTVAGVIKTEDPFFFEIEYLKQEGEKTIYLDIFPITLDEYLDFINTNQSFK